MPVGVGFNYQPFQLPAMRTLGMVVYARNHSTGKVGAGGSRGHSLLHSEFKASLTGMWTAFSESFLVLTEYCHCHVFERAWGS